MHTLLISAQWIVFTAVCFCASDGEFLLAFLMLSEILFLAKDYELCDIHPNNCTFQGSAILFHLCLNDL